MITSHCHNIKIKSDFCFALTYSRTSGMKCEVIATVQRTTARNQQCQAACLNDVIRARCRATCSQMKWSRAQNDLIRIFCGFILIFFLISLRLHYEERENYFFFLLKLFFYQQLTLGYFDTTDQRAVMCVRPRYRSDEIFVAICKTSTPRNSFSLFSAM